MTNNLIIKDFTTYITELCIWLQSSFHFISVCLGLSLCYYATNPRSNFTLIFDVYLN